MASRYFWNNVPREGKPTHILESPKFIRAVFNGKDIAASSRVKLVYSGVPGTGPWLYHEGYVFHPRDVSRSALIKSDADPETTTREGRIQLYHLVVDDRRVDNAAWCYLDAPSAEREAIKGWFCFIMDALDAWYEDDQLINKNGPIDPFHRIDVRSTSRRITVRFKETVIAESSGAKVLYETHIPARIYIPKTDVRMNLMKLKPDFSTDCQYKGTAQYLNLTSGDDVVEDIAWFYNSPYDEAMAVQSMISFYPAKVTTLIDGVELQPDARLPLPASYKRRGSLRSTSSGKQ